MPWEEGDEKCDRRCFSIDLCISCLWLCNKLCILISSKQVLFISQFLCVRYSGMDWVGNCGSGSHKISWPALQSSLDSTQAGESTSKFSHVIGDRIQFLMSPWTNGLIFSLAVGGASLSSLSHGPFGRVTHSMASGFSGSNPRSGGNSNVIQDLKLRSHIPSHLRYETVQPYSMWEGTIQELKYQDIKISGGHLGSWHHKEKHYFQYLKK